MGCSSAKPSQGAGNQAGGNRTDGSASGNSGPQGAVAHSFLVTDNPGKIVDFYELDKKKLGEGSYGTVCKGSNKSTKKICAVKSIAKAQMKNLSRFKQEIAIMKMMDHPNIIKLFETFEDHRNIYLVMELCTGGELFDRIIEQGHFSESKAAILMKQIVMAIFYMHEQHVCHRDLKPENFLFMTKESIDKTPLKIIDFGLSRTFQIGQVLTTKAGTPYYVAPQVLAGKYDQLSDLWSVGVIMYVMLCGYPPFFGETDAEVLSKVRLGNFSFNAADWKNVSEDAKNLIRLLLKMNPRDRYTAQQALNHDWIKNKAPGAKDMTLQTNFVDNLRGFRSTNKLKKAALHVIANQLNETEIKGLKDLFLSMDKNGDGSVTVVELKDAIQKSGLKDIPTDLQQILESIDSDGSGQIDYTEFLAATLEKKSYQKEEVLWGAFRVFDKNGDGKISQNELEQVLCQTNVSEGDRDEIKKLLDSNDADGDGTISFEEFCTMMKDKDV